MQTHFTGLFLSYKHDFINVLRCGNIVPDFTDWELWLLHQVRTHEIILLPTRFFQWWVKSMRPPSITLNQHMGLEGSFGWQFSLSFYPYRSLLFPLRIYSKFIFSGTPLLPCFKVANLHFPYGKPNPSPHYADIF